MKHCAALFAPALACLALVASVSPAPAADAEPAGLEVKARALVTALAKEDFDAAAREFDDAMRKALPADKLKQTWTGLVGQVGAFQKQAGSRRGKVEKYDVVWISCEFERTPLDVKVVFNGNGQVTGLFFTSSRPAFVYQAPAYVKRDAFQESEVSLGSGDWVLPGTLTLPVGDGPFPAVVLVHGSGPEDRDETIGGNKPFRDLAWGLATQGVAVLRYDKRTLTHAVRFAKPLEPLTVKEEVLDDVLAAVALLRKHKAVDGKRIFVLGHSLGGVLAPRIGRDDPDVAGLIILAGATRPLEDLILEQHTYLLSRDGPPSADGKAELEKIKAVVARIKDPKLSADAPAAELFGGSGAYWLSLRDYHPAEVARTLKQPLLILQGERDYQVSMTDFAGWKKALAGRKDVELKSYAKLNHLFVEGEGAGSPAEYDSVGHVSREVVDDVARWIKKR